MRKREELAWAAGFFDGEGSFHAHASKRHAAATGYQREYWSVQASVGNTDKELLDRFYAYVGVGRIKGPYIEQRGNRLPVYRWSASGHMAVQFLGAMLWPWLGTYKRERWEASLRAYRIHRQPTAVELKRSQEECVNGHPLVGPNVRIDTRGFRVCKTCARDNARASYARRMGQPIPERTPAWTAKVT